MVTDGDPVGHVPQNVVGKISANAPAREVAIVLRRFRHPRESAGVTEARPRDDDLREISLGLITASIPQRRNSCRHERAVATTEVRDTVQCRERFGCATLGIVKISSLSLCLFMCLCSVAGAAEGCPKVGDGIVTDRPDVTNSSIVVPVGSPQIENGVNFSARDGTGVLDGTNTRLRLGVAPASSC